MGENQEEAGCFNLQPASPIHSSGLLSLLGRGLWAGSSLWQPLQKVCSVQAGTWPCSLLDPIVGTLPGPMVRSSTVKSKHGRHDICAVPVSTCFCSEDLTQPSGSPGAEWALAPLLYLQKEKKTGWDQWFQSRVTIQPTELVQRTLTRPTYEILLHMGGVTLVHSPFWKSGPQFKSEFGNKEFMIWATVSSQSCFYWLYRASPSLAAKSIINLTSVLSIRWCPCVESSLVLLEEGVCYDQWVLLAKSVRLFLPVRQICPLLQVFLDFLLLHSSPL